METKKFQAKNSSNLSYIVGLALALVAILSSVGLDFINHKKNERSYFFRDQKAAVQSKPAAKFEDILTAAAEKSGFDLNALKITRDEKNFPVLNMKISREKYDQGVASFEKNLKSSRIKILSKLSLESSESTDFLWKLKKDRKTEATVIFSIPVLSPSVKVSAEPPPALTEKPVSEPIRHKKQAGQVALIVDDMGENLEALDIIISLQMPVTIAVLPDSSYVRETVLKALAHGLEVILHLPLESRANDNGYAGSDGFISTAMSSEEIKQRFEQAFARVPEAGGVNNHMGSRFTSEPVPMRFLLQLIKDAGLFFVDSRTASQSVAYMEAKKMGLAAAERDVFLDADSDSAKIKTRLIELFQIARKRGRALGICHPLPETFKVLQTSFHLLESYGLEAVPVSRLVK